jgi:DNA-binding transcriptional LysR family regulator
LAEAGLGSPQVAVEVNSTSALVGELLRHSDLVSVMSVSMLAGSAGHGLAALPMSDARFQREVGIVTRRDTTLPLLARRFIEIVQEVMKTRETMS